MFDIFGEKLAGKVVFGARSNRIIMGYGCLVFFVPFLIFFFGYAGSVCFFVPCFLVVFYAMDIFGNQKEDLLYFLSHPSEDPSHRSQPLGTTVEE